MISFDLNKLQGDIAQHNKAVPPVESWNPPFCGDIDLAIKHDSSWHYMGTPIGRIALVKLFASVLKREADNYFLVTPVEKVGIQVADCPFLITQWQQKDNNFIFTTNLDDTFVVSRDNPIELMSDKVTGDLLPYALVRRNLWARLHQNVFYQLVEAGLEKMIDAEPHLIISSAGQEFSLGKYV